MHKPVTPPHPFRVGEIYANRVGEYEVVSITPPKMTIRYNDNNRLLVTDIAVSARIWENMHLPPEVPEATPRPRAASKPAAAPRAPRRPPTPKE